MSEDKRNPLVELAERVASGPQLAPGETLEQLRARVTAELAPSALEVAARRVLMSGRRPHSGLCRFCGHEMYEDRVIEDTHDPLCPLLELGRALGAKVGAEYQHGTTECD